MFNKRLAKGEKGEYIGVSRRIVSLPLTKGHMREVPEKKKGVNEIDG